MKKALDIQATRWRGLASVAVLLAALLAPACDDTVTNPGTGTLNVRVTVEPNPVVGVQNILTGIVTASYEVRLQETGGGGGTIRFINAAVFHPETGLQVATNFFDSSDLIVYVGTDRIEPLGEVSLVQTVSYVLLPDYQVPATMTVTAQVEDDRGLVANPSILVSIVPPE